MKRLTNIIVLVVLALCGCGGGGRGITSSLHNSCPSIIAATSPAGSIGAIVDDAMTSEMNRLGIPGMAVAIAKNGTVLYTQGYGYADLSTCKPVQPAMEFQLGSVTKQFTAAAILQLQAAGKLNIDNSVLTYLPGFSFDPRITLRMLLNHTSGLADYTGFAQAPSWINGVPQQTVLKAIVQAPLIFTPGSAYSYSNSNYFILGAIIEAASSLTYADYLATHIFQPVGLSHTTYLQPATSALPYSFSAVPGFVADASMPFSAGTLWSNVRDLATWDAALLSGFVIPAAQFTEMVTPPASIPTYGQAGLASTYAMGWFRDTLAGHPVIFHGGVIYGYNSFNSVNLDSGLSVSILANVDSLDDSFGGTLIQAICTSAPTAGNC